MRLWAHERTPGVPRHVGDLQSVAGDLHLTRFAQVCFAGTEEAHSEPHDQGTIDNIVEDQDTDDLPGATSGADAEAERLQLIPLPGHPVSVKKCLASWVCLHGLKRTKCQHVVLTFGITTSASSCSKFLMRQGRFSIVNAAPESHTSQAWIAREPESLSSLYSQVYLSACVNAWTR